MTNNVDHVLLTRFNLPSLGAESHIRAQEGWLRDRVELFEKYCLPAVRAQSTRNFSWIIYFDPQSPQWLQSKISAWVFDDVFVPIFREEVSREDLFEDLHRVSGAKNAHLMTTNLDNDDGLATDFVERIQAIETEHYPQAIYVSQGLILKEESLYLNTDEQNAFCTVVETWDSPLTCWVDWHNRLADHMPITAINGAPGWLQVIHGRNVSNRVHGQRISPDGFVAIFGELIDAATAPRLTERLLEKWWSTPQRRTYEFVRRSIKEVILKFGGKAALDRLKNLIQRVRNFA
ncbi:glycosyltransferase [Glutamicibacter ectropisis]|uniref:Glycosyltransferase n=1 Tax=Glutamicibacter ectropisis TaxID=3046593 RepID=A0AAU6WJ12_9MICC